jgi:hypothetical protein
MIKRIRILGIVFLAVLFLFATVATASAAPSSNACWGQATKVYAQTGALGEHSSSFENPRLGLRNLARALYAQGVLEDDTMQALGAFVAAELGLSIDACQ